MRAQAVSGYVRPGCAHEQLRSSGRSTASGRSRCASTLPLTACALGRGFDTAVSRLRAMLIGRDAGDALAIVPAALRHLLGVAVRGAAFALADAAGISAHRTASSPPTSCWPARNPRRSPRAFLSVHARLRAPGLRAPDSSSRPCPSPPAAARPTRKRWPRAASSIAGLLAGKWPHTLALAPGGTTRPGTGEDPAAAGARQLPAVSGRRGCSAVRSGTSPGSPPGADSPAGGTQPRRKAAICALFLRADELGLASLGRLDLRR